MRSKMTKIVKTMGARADRPEQPLMPGQNQERPKAFPHGVDEAVINTVVRRLGFVALQVFNTIQGNLVSSNRHELAEILNDTLKPVVDMLLHFEIVSRETIPEGDDDETL